MLISSVRMKNVGYCSLGGINDTVVGIFFEANSLDCYTGMLLKYFGSVLEEIKLLLIG